jgi:hypothetical protein
MYWIAFAILSAFCAVAAEYSLRRSGVTRIVLGWLGPAALLIVLGWADWARQPIRETPLNGYLAGALLAPGAAFAAASYLSSRTGPAMRCVAAGLLSFVVLLACALASFSP